MQQRLKADGVTGQGSLIPRLEGAALPPWPVAAPVMLLCARMESATVDQIFVDFQHLFLSLSEVRHSCWLFKPRLTGIQVPPTYVYCEGSPFSSLKCMEFVEMHTP